MLLSSRARLALGNAAKRLHLAAVLTLALALSALTGCEVRAPGGFETRMITGIKHHVTIGGAKDKNPLPASAENVHAGEQQFQNYCTSCHGPDGRNTGVVFAERVLPPIPRLDSAAVQQYSDGQLRFVISRGVSPSGMPAWKGTLEDDDIWKIVLFIRSLPKSEKY
jgi:mono/diheme cytochrome c family protein